MSDLTVPEEQEVTPVDEVLEKELFKSLYIQDFELRGVDKLWDAYSGRFPSLTKARVLYFYRKEKWKSIRKEYLQTVVYGMHKEIAVEFQEKFISVFRDAFDFLSDISKHTKENQAKLLRGSTLRDITASQKSTVESMRILLEMVKPFSDPYSQVKTPLDREEEEKDDGTPFDVEEDLIDLVIDGLLQRGNKVIKGVTIDATFTGDEDSSEVRGKNKKP